MPKLRTYDRMLALWLVCPMAVKGIARSGYTGGEFDRLVFKFLQRQPDRKTYKKLSLIAQEISPDFQFLEVDYDGARKTLRGVISDMYGFDAVRACAYELGYNE